MADDLRYAVRSLLNSRGFTAVALLVIALSVGAIAPIYAIVDAVSLRPLPYPDADRLVVVRDADIPASTGRLPMSQRNYFDWAERQQGFEGIAAYRGATLALIDPGGQEIDVAAGRVTGNFFDVLKSSPRLGRAIAGYDIARNANVAVLSHGLWKRIFGGRADVLGRLVTIGGAPHEVVGVLPERFAFPAGASRPYEVFLPLIVPPAQRLASVRGAPFLTAIGRVNEGTSIAGAQTAMDGVAAALRREHPGWDAGVMLQPYHDFVTGSTATWMRLLLAGVVLVFLIMCANVANLLLARAGGRGREVALRAALGASRIRIARQLVLESLLLAVLGTAAGLLVGWWLLDTLRNAMPAGIPRAREIALDWRVLIVSAIAATVTGVVFGVVPAAFASRVDLSTSLKGSGTSKHASGSRVRHALVVAEVAVALVLLAGALMFTGSFLKVSTVPLGVDYEGVAVVPLQIPLPRAGSITRVNNEFWAARERAHDLADRVVAAVRAVPGVLDVAAASGFPFAGGSTRFSYELPGKPGFRWTRDQHEMVAMKMVSPNYLELLRIPLLRGRYLRATDSRDAEGALVLSETAARMMFPGEDPIGQEVDLQKHLRVVGVVADVRMGGPENAPHPDVYVPMLQGRGTMVQALLVRTALPVEQMLPSIRAAMQSVDASQRPAEVTTLEARLAAMLAQRRFNMLVVGSFGALGILIAAIGLYGVMAYLVTQRTHEIGVRMALGASRARVLGLVLRRAALLTALGLAIGGAGVWYFSAGVRAFLFELSPLDARVMAAAVAIMAAAAIAAALIPARRAASIDPLVALRQD